MLPLRLGLLVVLIALGVAACSSSNNTATPAVATPGPSASLNSSGAAVTATGVSGITSTVTVAGSGSVAASESSTQPTGLPAIMALLRGQQSAARSPLSGNTALVYIVLTASSSTSITGLPASSFVFASAPSGSVYLAYYNSANGAWTTLLGPGTVSGDTVTFGAATFPSAITLSSGGVLYLAVYTGASLVTPSPSPSPSPSASASPLADGNFSNANVTAVGGAIGSTGWTQCTVSTVPSPEPTYNGGADGAIGTPYTNATWPPTGVQEGYTPTPATTPAAVIVAAGASAPVGSKTPTPTQSTAPTYNSAANVAQFGQLFSNYNAGNYYYNGLCQVVNASTNGATVTAEVFEQGNEASKYVEDLVGTVSGTNSAGMTLSNILWMENIESSSSAGDTAFRQIGPFTLPAGQTTLFIGMWTQAGSTSGSTSYSSYWWIGQVSVTNN